MALAPQIIPSIPVINSSSELPVNLTVANRKNRTVKLLNTNCSARLVFIVPQNISNVNMPHMKKYAAIAVLSGAVTAGDRSVKLGSNSRMTRDHQNKP